MIIVSTFFAGIDGCRVKLLLGASGRRRFEVVQVDVDVQDLSNFAVVFVSELDMALDLGGLGASVFAPTAGVRFDSLVSHQMRLQTGSVGRGIRANVAEKRLDPLMSLYVSGEFEFGVRGVGANVTFCHFLIAMPFDMSG